MHNNNGCVALETNNRANNIRTEKPYLFPSRRLNKDPDYKRSSGLAKPSIISLQTPSCQHHQRLTVTNSQITQSIWCTTKVVASSYKNVPSTPNFPYSPTQNPCHNPVIFVPFQTLSNPCHFHPRHPSTKTF